MVQLLNIYIKYWYYFKIQKYRTLIFCSLTFWIVKEMKNKLLIHMYFPTSKLNYVACSESVFFKQKYTTQHHRYPEALKITWSAFWVEGVMRSWWWWREICYLHTYQRHRPPVVHPSNQNAKPVTGALLGACLPLPTNLLDAWQVLPDSVKFNHYFLKVRHRKEMPQVVSIPFQVPANASKIHRILGKPMKYALVDFQGVPLFRQWGSCVSSAAWRWRSLRTGWSRNGYEDCENREICWASPGFALACSPGKDNEIMDAIVRELHTRVIRIVRVFQWPLANEFINVNQSASNGSKYWIFDYRWTLRVFCIDVWHTVFRLRSKMLHCRM